MRTSATPWSIKTAFPKQFRTKGVIVNAPVVAGEQLEFFYPRMVKVE
jgi:hypothetical protein